MTKIVLFNNEEVYFESNPISCEVCHKVFSAISTLKLHKEIFHVEDSEIVFKKEVVHENEGTLQLMKDDLQGNELKREKEIQNYSTTHTSGRCVRPFSFNECENRFLGKNYLKKLHRTHTGENCNECQNVFPYKSSLKGQLRTYTSESSVEVFTCILCLKQDQGSIAPSAVHPIPFHNVQVFLQYEYCCMN